MSLSYNVPVCIVETSQVHLPTKLTMPAASQYTVKKTSANAFALCTYVCVCGGGRENVSKNSGKWVKKTAQGLGRVIMH